MSAPEQVVGIVGLGEIGAGAARALARSGQRVAGCDVRAEALEALAGVVTPADSPRAVAEAAGVVLVAVLNDAQVQAVLEGPDGVFAAADRPRAVVLLSTISLDAVDAVGARGAELGIGVLDCGVSGGRQALAHGSIVAMVGGSDEDFAVVEPVLARFASPIVHVGRLGDGMRAKIARNLIYYCQKQVAWEGARLARAAGIDLERFTEAVEASDRWVHGPMALVKQGVGLEPEPTDTVMGPRVAGYAHKDLRLALALGEDLGVELPTAAYTERIFDRIAGLTE